MKKAEKQKKDDGHGALAVIETGGKQYVVSAGTTLSIERIPNLSEGSTVVFDKVLLSADGGAVDVGTPYLSNRSVVGTITKSGRLPKVEVVHYKQKSRYLKTYGHRQPFMAVRVEEIK